MRPDERDAALLWDMLKAARESLSFVQGKSWDDYLRDRMLRAAVERVVAIIGEAASKTSRAFREQNPTISWSAIIALRHIVVHDYGKIDDEKIWRVATVHVPALVPLLEELIPPSPPDPFPEPN